MKKREINRILSEKPTLFKIQFNTIYLYQNSN